METWQALMVEGNRLFDHQKWTRALSHYQRAIALLEKSSRSEMVNIQQLIQGWVCGYHNIAATYERQELTELTRDALMIPFRRMLTLSNDPSASQEVKFAASSALKITLPPLLEFANNHPEESKFINDVIKQVITYENVGVRTLH
ncbi:hypothetical protein ACXJY6_05035 [Vibrio sp. RC27]